MTNVMLLLETDDYLNLPKVLRAMADRVERSKVAMDTCAPIVGECALSVISYDDKKVLDFIPEIRIDSNTKADLSYIFEKLLSGQVDVEKIADLIEEELYAWEES